MQKPMPFSKARFVALEFLIIVAGVLVALAVDQWRDGVNDRALETQYIQRLRADLVWDTASFARYELILDAKTSVLRDLISGDPISRLMDHRNLMADLVHSQFKSLPSNRASTFQELQSTGNLSLLRDFELRGSISEYYLDFDHISEILSSSPGEYRTLFLESMSGEAIYSWRIDSLPPDPLVLERGLQALLEDSELEAAVNAELGYAAGLAYYVKEYKDQVTSLLNRLGGA